jgi:hypothetical protein
MMIGERAAAFILDGDRADRPIASWSASSSPASSPMDLLTV